ncbi:MBL fold metallo-hydrolase RNA specificity domain-containing protein [Thiocapsa bogorovii]|uniref:MBL fold metallo-hydrolase RNA specificity domain-containing protein n=1 Tax=Thiocapsa bogorovii TaxID=521689 RepID=UPI001E5AFD43|nr:MBL fold metallo-hydrolase [Thiocapsa bogorovii]UHD17928.1 MBL fold metallo-hydrolase [Thiocapsa bogorovii]
MRLSFHGADRAVTGSCHLVEVGGLNILVDCGLFQGGREVDEENAADLGFDPESIDILLLTHAHLDHCGRIPLLVRRGFKGEIIATPASRELARVVLLDAAHLQQEEAERRSRKAHRRGQRVPAPLYGVLDALNAMDLFGRRAHYGVPIELADDVSATFTDAGHILGSASIRLEHRDGDDTKAVIFSGDLGNSGRPILRDPTVPAPADTVVMETTYGDRDHKPLEPSIGELYAAINDTLSRGGNAIIPTFALERAQELLYHLREGVEQGLLPRTLPVYLDSPMAISATEIFQHHPECYDAEARALFERGDDPFGLPGLRFTRETADSMALNRLAGGAVIMAGSGMCTGGRIRHHLRQNLWRRDSSVIFVGFAAPRTLARILIDGAKRVRLFGDDISVNAQLYTINGFSAHADRTELLAWHRAIRPERTILVHGEEKAMHAFSTQLRDTEVLMPSQGDTVAL